MVKLFIIDMPMGNERIKMPKRGVNWAFLKIIARIKSYKPNFTPSAY
jgi:hypothetical protein